MLTKWLEKIFIYPYKSEKNEIVRERYGVVAGFVGIFINLLLFIIKLIAGIITSSTAVTADAFNNLTDVMSSVIIIIGFRMSSKPPDDEHPFGHGRIEYIASLAVGILVLFVGFDFIRSSIKKVVMPEPVIFDWGALIILLVSILLKCWLALVNNNFAKIIDSNTLKAAATDSMNDVLSSIGVIVSLILSPIIPLPIDGVIGVCISVMILKSGYDILKENILPLLGGPPDPEVVKSVMHEVKEFPNVMGVHDLILNNYGPGRYIASIHMEFPTTLTAMEMHEIADEAEQKMLSKYDILLTVHVDPVDMEDSELQEIRKNVNELLSQCTDIISTHDFRIIRTPNKTNLIFDIVVSFDANRTQQSRKKLLENVKNIVVKKYPDYHLIIELDVDYTS